MLVIGLNPSTAHGGVDDPTSRRCLRFARDWGHGGLLMANLYAWRATRPADLRLSPDPVGRHNERFLSAAMGAATATLFAWGNHGAGPRADALLATHPGLVLGWTAQGAPRHPLYVRADTVPQATLPE